MSSVSLPVTRPAGRALVVGTTTCREQPVGVLRQLGFGCAEIDDPYTAMAELCQHPAAYRALILSLQSVYKVELQLIPAVKRRFPHVEVWLTDLDGRQGALAEAMRLGADGLISEEGLHRLGVGVTADPPRPSAEPAVAPDRPDDRGSLVNGLAGEAGTGDGGGQANGTPARSKASGRPPGPARPAPNRPAPAGRTEAEYDADDGMGEAVLTAEELRALLQEQPSAPPYDGEG